MNRNWKWFTSGGILAAAGAAAVLGAARLAWVGWTALAVGCLLVLGATVADFAALGEEGSHDS